MNVDVAADGVWQQVRGVCHQMRAQCGRSDAPINCMPHPPQLKDRVEIACHKMPHS